MASLSWKTPYYGRVPLMGGLNKSTLLRGSSTNFGWQLRMGRPENPCFGKAKEEKLQKAGFCCGKIAAENFRLQGWQYLCTCLAAPVAEKGTFIDCNLDLGALSWVTKKKYKNTKVKKYLVLQRHFLWIRILILGLYHIMPTFKVGQRISPQVTNGDWTMDIDYVVIYGTKKNIGVGHCTDHFLGPHCGY